MDRLCLLAADFNDMWYSLPLVLVFSLVYAATRHEQVGQILRHAWRVGIWVAGFMAIIFVVISLIS